MKFFAVEVTILKVALSSFSSQRSLPFKSIKSIIKNCTCSVVWQAYISCSVQTSKVTKARTMLSIKYIKLDLDRPQVLCIEKETKLILLDREGDTSAETISERCAWSMWSLIVSVISQLASRYTNHGQKLNEKMDSWLVCQLILKSFLPKSSLRWFVSVSRTHWHNKFDVLAQIISAKINWYIMKHKQIKRDIT